MASFMASGDDLSLLSTITSAMRKREGQRAWPPHLCHRTVQTAHERQLEGGVHLAVTARTVFGLALHSSTGSLPRNGSSSAHRNRAGVVMWGM